MEIIIAILWYLQVLIPGSTYTAEDIDNLFLENEAEINTIMADPTQSTEALDYFDASYDGSIEFVERPDIGKKHTEPIWER